MEEVKFTEQELKYINADIHDNTKCAYIIQVDKRGDDNLLVLSLPAGLYSMQVSSRAERNLIIDQLISYGISYMNAGNTVRFGINESTEYRNLGFVSSNIVCHVLSLRKQAIISNKNLLNKDKEITEKNDDTYGL